MSSLLQEQKFQDADLSTKHHSPQAEQAGHVPFHLPLLGILGSWSEDEGDSSCGQVGVVRGPSRSSPSCHFATHCLMWG